MFAFKRKSFALIWLVLLFIPMISFTQLPLQKAIPGYALIATFCFTYWRAFVTTEAKRWQIALLLAIIFILTAAYEAGNLNMLFYTAPLLAKRPTRREIALWTGAIVLGVAVVFGITLHPFNLDRLVTSVPFLLIMLALPFVLQSGRREQKLQEELAAANARNANLLRQEERHRIAKDLHDTLGHTLSLIVLKSELAEHLVKLDPERAQAEIRTVRETARQALREAREVVSQMRTVTLPAELAAAEELLGTAGIRYGAVVTPVELAPLAESMLGFCLREAVTNVVRHSRATACAITIKAERGKVILTIQDDGVGIQPNGTGAGTGLQSMRDRLQLVDGTLTVSEPPGTILTLQVPTVLRGGATHG